MPAITTANRVNLVYARIGQFDQTVNLLAESLRSGRITLGMWQEEMKLQIRLLHTGAAVLGKGGENAWASMTHQDWGRTGPIIREQYGFLHQFAQDIYDRRETISAAQIAWRSRLYGQKAAYTAMVLQAGDIAQFLPWIPRDGSTLCLNGCRCTWEIQEGEVVDGMRPVVATWTLHPAEHCETCISRDGKQVSFAVPGDWSIPSSIGGY